MFFNRKERNVFSQRTQSLRGDFFLNSAFRILYSLRLSCKANLNAFPIIPSVHSFVPLVYLVTPSAVISSPQFCILNSTF